MERTPFFVDRRGRVAAYVKVSFLELAMKRFDRVTRRGFLKSSSAALAPAASLGQQGAPAVAVRHRTQFDEQLLAGSQSSDPVVAANHGRHMVVSHAVMTALSWAGAKPVLRVWNDRRLLAAHPLAANPSAPVLAGSALWISAGGSILRASPAHAAPEPVPGLTGVLLDAVPAPDGRTVLVFSHEGKLWLAAVGESGLERTAVDAGAGRASLEFDSAGALHLAYEKRQGIEYRRYDVRGSLEKAKPAHAERVAEAFGFHPVLLAANGRLLLAWLGESCRLPSSTPRSPAWERLGRGGYIAVLVGENGKGRCHRLADSRQIVKPWAPIDSAYSGGVNRELRVHYEEFSAPTLCLGPDGVVQVLWADTERRWIYGARLLGDEFSPASEVRGPLEQLTGPCLAPRRVPSEAAGIPIAMVTRPRTYLDRIALPERAVPSGRRIDFVHADELAEARGVEAQVNRMTRRPENPIIPVDPPGGVYDGAIVPNILRDRQCWRADIMYISAPNANPNTPDRGWRPDGIAVSDDGIHWKKLAPVPLEKRMKVDGVSRYSIRFVEDPQEKNPAWRFKGFWRSPDHEPWGYLVVTSADGSNWTKFREQKIIVRADDDLRVWIDPDDIPERRFKASAISRSFCGRVCAQWTSPDGLRWDGERDTLDLADPFGARPDRGSSGRILLDSWSGPDDEDEIHGGYVFRDGQRWLLHYMKWTGDGHIYCGLAASRDGLNFARVGGGAPTLPLGEAGTWDGGRVALREAPFRVGDVWRQYYTGCGWKHGMGGIGAKTSHFGLNAPNQGGAAEIPVGHWVHVQVSREADFGEFTTVELRLARAYDLTADAEGLETPGASLACGVVDVRTGKFVPGFGLNECDPVRQSGRALRITWRGQGLKALGARAVRLRVRLAGYRAKLFGVNLI